MGAATSNLTAEEVHRLRDDTHFTTKEIERLYERYTQLDRSKSGLVSLDDLRLIPELSMNPLMPRILSLFAGDGENQINFRRFVSTLSAFHPKAPIAEKRILAFRVYDVDEDGTISEEDLFAVMKLLVGSNLADDRLRQVVRKTLRDAHAASSKAPPAAAVEPEAVDAEECKQGHEDESPLPGLDLEQFSIAIGDLSNFNVVIC